MRVVGVDFGSRPSQTVAWAPCTACRKQIASGMISYLNRIHEPHCDGCCKDWEAHMQRAVFPLTMDYFRAWQAQRARQ